MSIHISDIVQFEIRLTDSKNAVVKPSLNTATLIIVRPDSTRVERALSSLDVIVDEWFKYETVTADLPLPGRYDLQIRIVSGGKTNHSEQFPLHVKTIL